MQVDKYKNDSLWRSIYGLKRPILFKNVTVDTRCAIPTDRTGAPQYRLAFAEHDKFKRVVKQHNLQKK